MQKSTQTKIIRILTLVFVLGLTVVLFIFRDQVHRLQAFGYPGIFLVSLLANATLILPVPGVLLTSAMGVVFNPFWVAVAAGSGAALGEVSGYMAGFSGQGVIEKLAGMIVSKPGCANMVRLPSWCCLLCQTPFLTSPGSLPAC